MHRFLFACLFLGALSAAAQTKPRSFTLNGRFQGPDTLAKKVYIQYRGEQGWKMDSSVVTAGLFSFTGKIKEPTLARLMTRNVTENIFLMPGTQRIRMNSQGKDLRVYGSEAHRAYRKLKKKTAPYDKQYQSLIEQYQAYGKAKEKVKQAAVEEQIDSIDEVRKQKVYRPFLLETPNTPISPFVLQEYAGWDIDPRQIEPLYNTLAPYEKEYPSMKELKQSIDMAKLTQVGAPAMEFVQNDTLDKPVALSSFRGKYLLIDFWASWCGPCRAENPNVVKAFQQFRSKNFTILGVSLDRPGQKDKWMKAIHDDGLTWTQVSDLKFWSNAVAVQYGIRAIPQNLLIDPNGIIVGKNLRGEKLMSALEGMVK
ncbi:MAG: redoxin domain-containing protein [Bacteroidota bacterium]